MIEERILTAVLRFEFDRLINLKAIRQAQLPAPKNGTQTMLYMHVPFCESLCPYCSFHRFVCGEDTIRDYFQSLRRELELIADFGYRFDTLYIGGGTPTILIDELVASIDLAGKLFDIKEISCETNPNHLTQEKMSPLFGRVQRLSVGVQSLDDGLLRQMQRFEKYGSGKQILQQIENIAGHFPTLNMDMIFNFPSQTAEILQTDIDRVTSSAANQVTFYPLMTSPLVSQSLKRTVGAVGFKNEDVFYRQILKGLEQDFNAKSAWTFSRRGQGMIDEYIADGTDYVGCGSGAFSYLDGTLYVNTFSLKDYKQAISANRFPLSKSISFSRRSRMRYDFLMSLFSLQLDKKDFQKRFRLPIEVALPMEMAYLRAVGAFSNREPNLLELTPKGRYLSVVMMREFFSNMDKIRQYARQDIHPGELMECQHNSQGFTIPL